MFKDTTPMFISTGVVTAALNTRRICADSGYAHSVRAIRVIML